MRNEAYSQKNYDDAQQYYQIYLNRYPNGSYIAEVRQKMKKCQRRLKWSNASFIMYTYDKKSPFGFSFGSLNTKKAGFYFNIKTNPEIFREFDSVNSLENNEEGAPCMMSWSQRVP